MSGLYFCFKNTTRLESKVEFTAKQIYWLPCFEDKWNLIHRSFARIPMLCFRVLWVRISVCPSFLMGSLGGKCHPSTGWMRCPKDLHQAYLLSRALLNCELRFLKLLHEDRKLTSKQEKRKKQAILYIIAGVISDCIQWQCEGIFIVVGT